MPNFTGIYIESEKSHFIFLDVEPHITGDIISSLQSFETSLIMISMGRWTNALIGIVNAIEILTREFTSGDKDFYRLIDEFTAFFGISGDLNASAHRVRKKRNEFTHSAIIPDDNDDAIRSYMEDALSVYKVFLEKSANINIYNIISIPRLRENLAFTKNDIKKLSDDYKHVGYHLAVLVKTIANHIHDHLTPEAMYHAPDENSSWEAWEEIKDRQNLFEELHEDQFFHDAISCPADCGGFLSLGLDDTKGEKEFQKNPFSFARCPKCGLMILPSTHIRKFVLETLSPEQINKMIR
jgi:hypothetical protein